MSIAYIVVVAVGAVACFTDLRSRRIPNALTFGAAAAGLLYHIINGGWQGLVTASSGWAVGVVAFMIPFALGGLGAGDVKLLAALGAWLGPSETAWVALYTGIAGGVLAIVVAAMHGYLGQALSNVRLLLSHWSVMGVRPLHEVSLEGGSGPRLAYAVPIFVGMLVTLWLH
jgi:prepilin peptidase CpaA